MRASQAPLLLWVVLLATCSPGEAAAPQGPPTATVVILADCTWSSRASAWLDANGDGARDPGEPPLAGVAFLVDDVRNRFMKVGRPATSGANGEAELFVALPGCPLAEFEVYAQAPTGYRATTPARLRQRANEPFQFGFAEQP